ncbi:MAG: biliverdin-producing heme oxygenase [Pirellula sp.]|nr:biliverdin-producing heme oxygenase [Pirellula sp.]
MLTQTIRATLSELHREIETTPIAAAMVSDFLHPMDYCVLQAQLFHIHKTLEEQIEGNPSVQGFFSPEMVRTATIEKDLSVWAQSVGDFKVLSPTSRLCVRMRYWGINRPESLLGCIYVLEGSRMGSLIIGKTLGRALGLPSNTEAGLAYHLEGAEWTPRRFKGFKEAIDTASWTEDQKESIIEGAADFMSLLLALYKVIPVRSKSESLTIPFPNTALVRPENLAS